MKIDEVTRQVQQLRPRAARKAARINQLVSQKIRAADQQPPTQGEVVLAQFAYRDLERRTDAAYLKALRQQLAAAKANLV